MYISIHTYSAFLFGSSSWVLTVERESKLRKAQRQTLRSMLQIGRRRMAEETSETTSSSSSTSSTESVLEPWSHWIRRVTRQAEAELAHCGYLDWISQQRQRLYRWVGHVARRQDCRWSCTLLQWNPGTDLNYLLRGRGRQQGRPCKRWADVLDNFLIDWQDTAQERIIWTSLEQCFLQA